MQFEAKFVPEFDDYMYTLTVSAAEMRSTKFSNFDKLLFADVQTSKDTTIADQLLALEVVARRIEEQHANRD